ncbi:hypothetical protein [Streptomyces sp. CC210A]|uniref:hypothetical protein n=1 Tax=Streptomyces sp. CC210A TaxID=2898184 RepID=UPI001F320489|nr:hypothetical protein [Streptomyces sp. CC210A]
MSMVAKGTVAAAAAAVVLTGISAGPAAATTNSTKTFNVSGSSVGHSGYSNGYIHFYNRSVGITGKVKSNDSNCVQVIFSVWSHGEQTDFQTRTACGRGPGTETGFNFTSPANFPGGASDVQVTLAGITGTGQVVWLAAQSVTP